MTHWLGVAYERGFSRRSPGSVDHQAGNSEMVSADWIAKYQGIEVSARNAEPTTADYAVADGIAQSEFERGGRLARRGQLYDGFGVSEQSRERWAKSAAYERVMRENGVEPPVLPLSAEKIKWVATVPPPSSDVYIEFPLRDEVVMIIAPNRIYCDYAGGVMSRMRRDGYLVTYRYDTGRNYSLRGREHTRQEMREQFTLIEVGQ